MKKLLVCLTLAAFATVTSLQAGEQCAATTGTCSAQAKTSCSAATASKSSCCSATAKVAKKNVDVKGATLLVKR